MFLYDVYIRSKFELLKVTKYGSINETAPLITKLILISRSFLCCQFFSTKLQMARTLKVCLKILCTKFLSLC